MHLPKIYLWIKDTNHLETTLLINCRLATIYCVIEDNTYARDIIFSSSTEETYFSRFSRNSEATASEFLENHEEMFPRYL